MDTTEAKLKVLMLPWLAHGHVSPYLELSKKLICKNFFIYFCSTPVILASIKDRIDEEQSPFVELVELHLTPSPDLPPHHHSTKNLPNHLIPKLKDALDMAAPSFSLILESLKPDLVVYDIYQPWAATLSSSHNIPAVNLLTSGAAILAFGFRLRNPGKEFPCRSLTPRYFQNFVFRGGERTPERQQKVRSGIMDSITRSSEILLIKTFEELEGEYFDYLSEVLEKKVVPVGPLIESSSENGYGNDEIMKWLDKKEDGSTVLVSFGSESFLRKDEIEEVALGLELSNVNFLWVLRFPVGEETKTGEVLPKGFLERVGDRGMIWQSWAPQIKILAHSSIGGFITHCGWSSIMESMGMGVPIIALPLHLDQPFNARLVEDRGVGLEVWRDEKNNGAMRGEEIAKTVRNVIIENEGEGIRTKAKEFSEIMKRKEEERIVVVIKELRKLCEKTD